MRDPDLAFLEFRSQLGNVVRHGHRHREALLFVPCRGQLGLERCDVGVVLRQLRGDLGADVCEHDLKDALAQHVLLKMTDQGGLHFGHRLVHRDRADRAPALVVLRAAVAAHAFRGSAEGSYARRCDCAAARTALRDSGQRILRCGTTGPGVRPACREPLVHREPRRVIHDPPLGKIDHHDLVRLGLHANRTAALAHLLDPAVDVDAAITRVEQDRPHGTRRPRTTTATPGGRRWHAIFVQAMRDLLLSAPGEVLDEDALDDRCLLVVDDRNRVAAAGSIGLPLQRVAVASATRDAALANAASQTLARARADRFELHLMPGALNERRGLIDRVGELHLLAGRVVVEVASAIANEVADYEGHLDRIATEPRLIAADDHVTALGVGEKLTQARAREEVIARATIVNVVDEQLRTEFHALDQLVAALGLNVEAELLLPLVVLRAPSVRSDRHLFPLVILVPIVERNHPAARGISQSLGSAISLAKISSCRTSTRASVR